MLDETLEQQKMSNALDNLSFDDAKVLTKSIIGELGASSPESGAKGDGGGGV
jgi:hypothetical protein